MIWRFKEGISNEILDIILNPSHFLVFNYILDGMILKRKKIVIQWRKFGLKRSCIFKVMNFWSLCPFLFLSDFKLIFIEFILIFLIKIAKRGGGVYPQTPRMTWRAGPACECDAALRPRGRAARGPHEAQAARTRGRRPCGSTRKPVRGATWQGGRQVKGPLVSGPW